jgi:enoyl-CoA hydratase
MIIREDRGPIAVLRLAHGKVSAMDVAFADALRAALAELRTSPHAAIVLTGTGSSFSAGVDLFQVVGGGAGYLARFLPLLDAMLLDTLTMPKPIVAAVNGHAIAGGCILAAACDYRVMAEGSGRIGVPELIVGVPFPTLALEIVASRVSPATLRDLVFTGRTYPPREALGKQLVDALSPAESLLDRTVEMATRLGSIPARSFALAKQAFNAPILERARRLADANHEVARVWALPETHAAIRAYLDRTLRK